MVNWTSKLTVNFQNKIQYNFPQLPMEFITETKTK